MRDDLHHSLPLSRPWKAAVKAACYPDFGGNLADALTRAAWGSAAGWLESSWGKSFTAALSAKQSDMFDQERLEYSLDSLEQTAPDHNARRACDIARAAVLSAAPGADLARQVIRTFLVAVLEDGVECAAARIERLNPGIHAVQVRRRMYAEIPNCNLSERPSAKKRAPKSSLEDGLGIALKVPF